MSFYALVLLAFGMAMDAFAVSLAKGAAVPMRARRIAATALLFGSIEALTPVAGWLAGTLAKPYISAWDHWLAFGLLGILGTKMLWEGLSGRNGDGSGGKGESWWLTAATALGTSIDSLIVGVGLAFMDVHIAFAALAIGVATTLMTAAGLTVGRAVGGMMGGRAEAAGGLVLIGIGTWTLLSHLGFIG